MVIHSTMLGTPTALAEKPLTGLAVMPQKPGFRWGLYAGSEGFPGPAGPEMLRTEHSGGMTVSNQESLREFLSVAGAA
jgi:hypothetical protein